MSRRQSVSYTHLDVYKRQLRPEDKPVHLTAGVQESNISEKYYEPPLMQVIPSALSLIHI